MLSLDIRVAYPGFALEVAQDIPARGITALFGPSGSGKTTLLRAIAGFEPGARGRIALGGEVWMDQARNLPAHRRGVGMVFQDARLFEHMNVRANLAYAEKRARAERPRYGFDDVVEALGLAPLLARAPGRLSGGERQLVAIGRALLARPRLLLMDEPLAALDTRRKAKLLPFIARLPETFAIPILHVTHALEEVTQISDRIVALAEGKVRAAGDVAATLERLDLGDVQGHFEAGAVLTGRVIAHEAALCLTRVDLGGGAVLEMPRIDLEPGAAIRMRIRARDVALAHTPLAGLSIRNQLAARVLAIAPEADTAFAEIRLAIGTQHLRARITRASLSDLALGEGQEVVALIKSVAFDRQALPRGG